ncbi:hypothetical protein BS47DRAFT_518928 [Hydnum rufescens UP504]|uniref:Uncharacterized protein n=1 Tax=Hydnum rufescens UP504 TaxID=1448309 RepID=A0A9P6DPF2_9AGAM|nr:hypothetical protein BS47DRAFT_518928 [Hydnum rufescens UP504]
MFSILHALIFLGASSYAACSAVHKTTHNAAPPAPQFKLVFTCNLALGVAHDFSIVRPQYTRVTLSILGGNWTDPDGMLIANVVPGIGGEWGTVDSTGTLTLDADYYVQFVHDKKYAYVRLGGFGVPAKSDDGRTVVETDSLRYSSLNNVTFVSPGVFSGNVLVSPHWASLDKLG